MAIPFRLASIGRSHGAFWPYLRLRGLIELLLLWHDRASQRQRLAQLQNRDLADIGITHEQAAAEFRKPFWRP